MCWLRAPYSRRANCLHATPARGDGVGTFGHVGHLPQQWQGAGVGHGFSQQPDRQKALASSLDSPDAGVFTPGKTLLFQASRAHGRLMRSSAECRARAAIATATAESVSDEKLRAQFLSLADEWLGLAVAALAQEVMEADLIGRELTPAPPQRSPEE
jgi:hypothetical protein